MNRGDKDEILGDWEAYVAPMRVEEEQWFIQKPSLWDRFAKAVRRLFKRG